MAIFLKTTRLIIQTSSVRDLKNWVTLYSDSEQMSYKPEIIKQWLDQDRMHFKKYGFGMGSVYEKKNHCFVGRAGIVYLDYDDSQPNIEIGYILDKAYWNKGYATELAKALVKWGFQHLSVNKLVAVTRPENKKSQHVLEKTGMHYVKLIQIRHQDFFFYEIHKNITHDNMS